jgi:hypothetical protein
MSSDRQCAVSNNRDSGREDHTPADGCLVGFYRKGLSRTRCPLTSLSSISTKLGHWARSLPSLFMESSRLGFAMAEAVVMKRAGITPYFSIESALELRGTFSSTRVPWTFCAAEPIEASGNWPRTPWTSAGSTAATSSPRRSSSMPNGRYGAAHPILLPRTNGIHALDLASRKPLMKRGDVFHEPSWRNGRDDCQVPGDPAGSGPDVPATMKTLTEVAMLFAASGKAWKFMTPSRTPPRS